MEKFRAISSCVAAVFGCEKDALQMLWKTDKIKKKMGIEKIHFFFKRRESLRCDIHSWEKAPRPFILRSPIFLKRGFK
jgi:hypothetical protein